MSRALPHLLARVHRALAVHYLRSRQRQLHGAIRTLVDCITHDQALIADLRRELQVIDARLDGVGPPPQPLDQPLFRGPV